MGSITQNTAIVALKLPSPVPALIKVVQAILTALTGNAFFTSPNPPLATLNAALTALVNAETATQTRAKGTVQARNAARAALLSELKVLRAYVQQVADASPEQAEAIITSAGMAVRKPTSHPKAPFTVKLAGNSGTVHLAVKAAARRAAYDWAWSSDGGKTWTQAPSTLQAKTTIAGLPAGTTVQFRFRAVVEAGEGDWSQPISLLVS